MGDRAASTPFRQCFSGLTPPISHAALGGAPIGPLPGAVPPLCADLLIGTTQPPPPSFPKPLKLGRTLQGGLGAHAQADLLVHSLHSPAAGPDAERDSAAALAGVCGAAEALLRCGAGSGHGCSGRSIARSGPALTLPPGSLRPPSAAVGLGYAAPHRFQTNLYTKQPEGGACCQWGQLPRRGRCATTPSDGACAAVAGHAAPRTAHRRCLPPCVLPSLAQSQTWRGGYSRRGRSRHACCA